MVLVLTLSQLAVTIWIYQIDEEGFNSKIKDWKFFAYDDFYSIFEAIMIYNVLNFFMSMFAIYMLEKMSRAKWSIENDDSE